MKSLNLARQSQFIASLPRPVPGKNATTEDCLHFVEHLLRTERCVEMNVNELCPAAVWWNIDDAPKSLSIEAVSVHAYSEYEGAAGQLAGDLHGVLFAAIGYAQHRQSEQRRRGLSRDSVDSDGRITPSDIFCGAGFSLGQIYDIDDGRMINLAHFVWLYLTRVVCQNESVCEIVEANKKTRK